MENKKILGFRKFNSRKGTACCIVSCATPYTDREIEFGACGTKIEEVWIPEEYHHLFTPQVIGKNVILSYDIISGRAYIKDVKIG